MRCLGEIEGRKTAEALVAYLLTKGITTNIEATNSEQRWEVWVREEDRVEEASKIFSEFELNPGEAKYQAAISEATQILKDREKRRAEAAGNMRKMNYRSATGARRPMPLTITLAILCGIVSLLSNFGSPGPQNRWGQTIMNELSFLKPADAIQSKGDPAASLKTGQVWRAITPIFPHGSPFHLVVNLFILISFGRIVEGWLGTPKYAVFILLLAIFPNLLQGLMPPELRGNPDFIGISGVTYGLLAFVWIRAQMDPTLGVRVPTFFVMLAIGYIVIGLSGAVPNWQLADLCHLGGLMLGGLAAFLPIQLR